MSKHLDAFKKAQPDAPLGGLARLAHAVATTPDAAVTPEMRKDAAATAARVDANSTSGPWYVKRDFNVFAGERLIATCGGYSSNRDSERVQAENIANAHLVASAPSLYAYAKAEQLWLAMDNASIGEFTTAERAYHDFLVSLGWQPASESEDDFRVSLRATALAIAEGRNP